MSKFFSSKYDTLTPYTPGEQPQQKQVIKLNTNENPFPPSPLAQQMARMEAGELNLYNDPECRCLNAIAAEKFGVESDELLFTNGSDEILNFAFMAFCDKDRPAVFADITYGFYPVFASLNGVPYETIPLKDDLSIDVNDYLGTGKTVFIANPNAPSGLLLSAADIERIVASNPDNVVVVDEAYIDFGGESVLPLIHKYDNLLVCRTFSKSRSMAGARLGFGAGCKALIRDLNTVKYSTNPYNVNRMTMAAGVGSLCDEAYFEKNRLAVIATRDRSIERLRELGYFVTDSKTNFLFTKAPFIGGKALCLALREKGIIVRHFDVPRITDYIRVSIGSDEQMDRFFEALEEIRRERA